VEQVNPAVTEGLAANAVTEISPTDEDGLFEICMESIGGLGAHLAGKMLAEAAVLGMGLNGAHFSSYGSEKKGSPIKSFVRLCAQNQELRTSAQVERPFVIAVFHETILNSAAALSGLRSGGTLIVNTPASPTEIREWTGLQTDTVVCIDATGIALEEGSRVNTAMLGALTQVVSFLNTDAVRAVVSQTFHSKKPAVALANLKTFDRARTELVIDSRAPSTAGREVISVDPAWGYLNAPLGGAIINPANTVEKNLSGSRTGIIPVFEGSKCVHCALCDLVCSDNCLVWDIKVDDGGQWLTRLAGIDYQYCKGCMACVDSCPTGAMREERETPGFADEHRVPLNFKSRPVDGSKIHEPS